MASIYLTQGLHRSSSLHPGRVATIFGKRRTTYGQIQDRVARLAAGLQQLGLRAGDPVAVLALNSDRYLELYFAIWWAGGVVNPINTRWSSQEIVYSIDDCRCQILVVDDAFMPMVTSLSHSSEFLRAVIHCGDEAAQSGMFSYEQLIADTLPIDDALRCGDDLAGIFYTGGTTGFPKGVMLSHANLWSCAISVIDKFAPDRAIALHAAPMFHLADGLFLLSLTLRGSTQVIVPRFDSALVSRLIQDEKINIALLVPTMIQMLVDQPAGIAADMRSLRRIVYGASPINQALLKRTRQRLPTIELVQAYGLTEMSPMISVLDPAEHGPAAFESGRIRSAGRPCECVEVRIVDVAGKEVSRGTVGEIVARGPGMMQGYWGKPEQTAQALRNGWLHTGDSAYMDDEGFIYIVDRMKDMIVTGGENVYSAEAPNAGLSEILCESRLM
jgi:long-chain acyl-CoA synthetase